MEPLSKARIKLIQSLQHKKFRQKYDKFIVEGLKINMELIREKKHLFESIYVSNPDHLALLENIIHPGMLISITPQQMSLISQMVTPPGILSVCHLPEKDHLPEKLTGLKLFYLDAIRDPGNLGTIIRIADWFGIAHIICSPDSVDLYNHKVLQSSMGSALRIKCIEMEIHALLLLDLPLYVSDAAGSNMYDMKPPAEGIIVLGNESLGVSDDIRHKVTQMIAIPRDQSLGAESLNVASAAAIIASWWTRS